MQPPSRAPIFAIAIVVTSALAPTTGRAQPDPRAWNAPAALELARRASARRQTQLADTALHDYKALARGYLTFLGQLGEGLTEPPRVIQASQVATEVYWRAPNVSKQRVVGSRDTTVLPTDNAFYRDRYGIVQNNFPDVIRVGEGRDVADVPHPLAPLAIDAYDFAIRDSLRIRIGGTTLGVIEVEVRPRDPTQPRFVGSLFIDRDDAQVVRMAFTFTHAAYLDKRNEDVSIVLENALVQGRFWLPRHQELEVRRTGTWLDFPARGIIRGRWEISDYTVNPNLPVATFAGPALAFAPPEERARYPFGGRVLDSLPADVRLVSDADVARVQARARALVQAEVLARARGGSLSARSISDFARVNRVEGLALGAGYLRRLGSGLSVAARARYGLDDEQVKGRLTLQRLVANGLAAHVLAYHDLRDVGDEPEVSLARNTLAAQEFGTDDTDLFRASGIAIGVDGPTAWRGLRPTAELSFERQRAASVHATPFNGAYDPTIAATSLREARLELGVERPTAPGPFATEWRVVARARGALWRRDGPTDPCAAVAGCGAFGRFASALHVERPFGTNRLVSHTTFAFVSGSVQTPSSSRATFVPLQDAVYLGGPVTGPGFDYHQFVGRIGASQHVEWRSSVPFVGFPLGGYGRAPASATIAPYVHTIYLAQPAAGSARAGWYPSLGVAGYLFFDVLRLDVARGLRDGRWTFGLDVTRDFWRIL